MKTFLLMERKEKYAQDVNNLNKPKQETVECRGLVHKHTASTFPADVYKLKRQGIVTMTIVREWTTICRKLETLVTLGYKVKILSVGILSLRF